jgi:hypothetical protein
VKNFAYRSFLQAVCAASLFLGTTAMFAEESDSWIKSIAPFPGEYVVEETYVGEGDVRRGPHKSVRDFDENDSILELVFTPRIKLGVLRLGAEWERFSFGVPDGAPLPDTLQSVNLVIGLDTQFSDSILIRVEAHPGVYNSGLDDLSNDFNLPFVIGGTYIYSPDLQIVLGVGVDVERKYPVIPVAGVRWKMARQWVLDAVLPTPRLDFEINRDVTLYAGANVKQTNFRVDDNFGDAHGIPKLNHAILSYSEVRTGAGFDWKVSPIVTFTGEVGYQPYRNFDFYRADVRYHQESGAPYGMLSLHGAF